MIYRCNPCFLKIIKEIILNKIVIFIKNLFKIYYILFYTYNFMFNYAFVLILYQSILRE